ncbi:GDSL-type esterase/lipase family protein [Neobacillus sp. D3-1R]|uniref:GDSL-type esterase/lipase family protein n=1 Tax=Neobacillus sp. D3-1R TaxID=3445778 RepID=UPI003FA056D1
MRMVKFLLIFVLFIALGISTWIYYPQYQIHKMKKQAVKVSADTSKISYIDYFRDLREKEIYNLAIGDSVIRGVGAKQNENLVYRFSSKLQEQTKKNIQYENEGINGITSSELKDLVLKGRYDDGIKKADIVTINVGGNDVLRMVKNQNIQTVIQSFEQLQLTFSKNLAEIAERIHKINPDATLVFLELYNPIKPSEKIYTIADKLLPTWNIKIYEVANQYASSVVIETTKVMNGDHLQNIAPDGVHPNSSGYMAISDQMIYQLKKQYRKKAV